MISIYDKVSTSFVMLQSLIGQKVYTCRVQGEILVGILRCIEICEGNEPGDICCKIDINHRISTRSPNLVFSTKEDANDFFNNAHLESLKIKEGGSDE